MNSVSENLTEPKPADFLEEFEQQENEQRVNNESTLNNCFSDDGEVLFENIIDDDILNNRLLYEYIYELFDEIEVQDYTTKLRQIAKKYGLAGDFDNKMKPYHKQLKVMQKEKEKEARQQAFEKRAENFPEWWDGQTIDEEKFCKVLLEKREIKCINGFLYDVNGLIDEADIESQIYNQIKGFYKKSIGDRIKAIVRTLKVKCYSPPLEADTERIHLKNGTLSIDGSFDEQKYFCSSRLDVYYKYKYKEPEHWLKFVNELLEPEDILTLQEYMGYCLIPSTKAQKMLMIIGNGGEGKSRIGIIMKAIFGQSGLVSGEVKDLDNGSKARFAREKLISRLVFLDDDLDLSALAKTSFLKQLITAEIPLEIEGKGKASIQAELYSRVIAFGNGAISSLYDKSDGFYRRQIILTAKPKPADRQDDKFLSDKLKAEKDMIFLWCFKGLQRLYANGFNFTISEQARKNLEESRREGCNIIDFMETPHEFCFDENGQIHTRELNWAYEHWCALNGYIPLRQNSLVSYLKANQEKYHIKFTYNAINQHGIRARGFKGIRYLVSYKDVSDI